MVSRAELKSKSEYQNALAIDKIIMEDMYVPDARRYRRYFQIPLAIIGTVGMPIATYYLSKKGIIAPDPSVIRYCAGGLAGLVIGWTSGLVLGTLAYETVSPEGDIRQFFSKVKNYITTKRTS